MVIGYARVSTADQNLDRQLDNLNAKGCERIFKEKMTGTSSARPELEKMLAAIRKGDTLVIDSFSRLSRSTKDLLEIIDNLDKQGVSIISLKENLDTTTATGKMMMTMLSALSQFERDLISERTKDGLKAARARGRNGGRPKAKESKIKQAMKLYDTKTMSISEITTATGISTATLYRYLKQRDSATLQA